MLNFLKRHYEIICAAVCILVVIGAVGIKTREHAIGIESSPLKMFIQRAYDAPTSTPNNGDILVWNKLAGRFNFLPYRTSTGGAFGVVNSSGTTTLKVQDNGHQSASGTPPTLSGAAPATPSVAGNDNRGIITLNGTTSTLVVTFAFAWTNTPSCVVSMATSSATNILKYTVSNTAITFSTTTGSGIDGYKGSILFYDCGGINE